MIKTALTFAFAAVVASALMSAPGQSATETELLRYERACSHFENKARFKSRGPAAELDAILADSCRAAAGSLKAEMHLSPYVSKRARLYLDRLIAFKSTVTAMNLERFRNRTIPGQQVLRSTVTPTGEYMIATHMGLMRLYRDWADETDFKLAGT